MREESSRAESHGLLTAIRSGETFRALHNRNYRLLWTGMVGHSTSLWVENVARSWLIWQLTGSATLLAVVNLLRALPLLSMGLLAGVAADRFDKRKILIICQTATLVNKAVLALLIITGVIEVWQVLLSAFLMGSSMAFEQPTRTSLIPGLVGKDELGNAVALNSAAMSVTRIVGPAVAGMLIAPLGIGGVYFASAGVYLVTLTATIMLRVPPVIARIGRTTIWTDLSEAFRYVYWEKSIFYLVLLALVPMVFGMPYMTLMPIFADRVLDTGASGFGWLYSATGAGAFLAVMIVATLGRVPRKGLVVLLAIFGFGIFLIGFSQSTLLPLSLVLVAFTGFAFTGSTVLINTSLLEIAPPAMQGRVMAVYMLDRGLMPLGTMVVGPLADVIGAPSTVLIMGGICALLALSVGIGVPFVRRML
ncbi:MFS transporter [Chloroflexota bacterium]